MQEFFRTKIHAAARPVGPEASGLDACELDAPFGLHLLADGFGEAFDGPLGCAVSAKEGLFWFLNSISKMSE